MFLEVITRTGQVETGYSIQMLVKLVSSKHLTYRLEEPIETRLKGTGDTKRDKTIIECFAILCLQLNSLAAITKIEMAITCPT